MRPRDLLLAPLRGYKRFISPWLPPACRFHPSCSEYAMGAIEHYGAWVGVRMAVLRLLRCNPFFAGGYDPPVLRSEVAEERRLLTRDT